MNTTKYRATRNIDYDRRYTEGETIELDDATAKPLLDCGAVVPHDPKTVFQDALRKTEEAARALEAAGGRPDEAAAELHRQRTEEERKREDELEAERRAKEEQEAAARRAAEHQTQEVRAAAERSQPTRKQMVADLVGRGEKEKTLNKLSDDELKAMHAKRFGVAAG